MINGNQSRNDDGLMEFAMATACPAQLLINLLDAADAELGVSFHDGVASPPSLGVRRWRSTDDCQAARPDGNSKKRRFAVSGLVRRATVETPPNCGRRWWSE